MFQVGQELILNQGRFRFAEHPVAPGVPYGQEGRAATVYKLLSSEGALAIKVFKNKYRNPALVRLTKQLQPFAKLDGLSVCNRYVLTTQNHNSVLAKYPDLLYSVVMPWIEGETWMDVILEKKRLNRETVLPMVTRFLQIMVNLEEQGIAHCDLSGANVMLPVLANSDNVELVDVEQIYAPTLTLPESLATGTPGYVHPRTPSGGWNAAADRFAGAILLMEMMGWSDERVREASWDESYFEQKELQQNTDRYHVLKQSLQKHWGENTAGLLEQVWHSNSPNECPTFGEWYLALNGQTVDITITRHAPVINQTNVDAVIESQENEHSRRQTSAAAPPPPPPSPPTSIKPHQTATKRQRTPATTQTVETDAISPHQQPSISHPVQTKPTSSIDSPPRAFEEKERWKTNIPESSTESKANTYLAAFLGVAALIGLLILVFNQPLQDITDTLWKSGGYALYNGIGAGALSLIISLVQTWIFRYRLPDEKRFLFILSTTAAGVLGGFIGGMLINMGIISWSLIGLVVGIVGGTVASFAQSSLMRNNEAKEKWIAWNTGGWIVAWSIGWYIGLIIAPHSIVGMAVSAVFITAVIGFTLTRFLKSTPEFEF